MGVIPALVMLIAVQSVGKLSKAKAAGSAFLKDAPLAFVVLGDPQVSDVWVEDASIASIIIQLVAQSLWALAHVGYRSEKEVIMAI